ncbi:hypothetical protein [Paraburkholderia fungorum]|uniref:Uncharacterized protein n=1 Tax=Paraburkholderia fungorum TaxID=134537 RepID=A0A3R7HHP3_9BURK|nr:hypothetical protein [Paraburkholderia fungorum]RKF46168.1 hypothetical protein BCY88_25105 [Paraburkholderia fungorum]
MFTPEFVSEELGEFVLVANHSLESAEAVHLSIEYNRARIVHGRPHLPLESWKCRLVYDVRGQSVSEVTIDQVRAELRDVATVEFKR